MMRVITLCVRSLGSQGISQPATVAADVDYYTLYSTVVTSSSR